jgi:hypothetical protein
VKTPKQAEADQTVEDEKDRDDEIEESRHDQNQDAGDHGHDRRDVSDGQGHEKTAPLMMKSNRGAAPYHPPCLVPRQQTLLASTGSGTSQKFIGNNALFKNFFWGTMPAAMNWLALQAGRHAGMQS